jgi:hypothetical protein
LFALWAWNRYQPTTYTLEFVLCEWMVTGLLLDDALGWGVLGSVFEVYPPWPQPPPEARNRHEGNLSNSNNMCIMCSSISFSNNVFFEEPGNGINRACFGGYSTLRFVKIQPGHPGEFRTLLLAPGADTWLPSPSLASRLYACSLGNSSNFDCCMCNADDWVLLLCPAQYKGKSSNSKP